MFATPDSRAHHIERQHSDIKIEIVSGHESTFKLIQKYNSHIIYKWIKDSASLS